MSFSDFLKNNLIHNGATPRGKNLIKMLVNAQQDIEDETKPTINKKKSPSVGLVDKSEGATKQSLRNIYDRLNTPGKALPTKVDSTTAYKSVQANLDDSEKSPMYSRLRTEARAKEAQREADTQKRKKDTFTSVTPTNLTGFSALGWNAGLQVADNSNDTSTSGVSVGSGASGESGDSDSSGNTSGSTSSSGVTVGNATNTSSGTADATSGSSSGGPSSSVTVGNGNTVSSKSTKSDDDSGLTIESTWNKDGGFTVADVDELAAAMYEANGGYLTSSQKQALESLYWAASDSGFRDYLGYGNLVSDPSGYESYDKYADDFNTAYSEITSQNSKFDAQTAADLIFGTGEMGKYLFDDIEDADDYVAKFNKMINNIESKGIVNILKHPEKYANEIIFIVAELARRGFDENALNDTIDYLGTRFGLSVDEDNEEFINKYLQQVAASTLAENGYYRNDTDKYSSDYNTIYDPEEDVAFSTEKIRRFGDPWLIEPEVTNTDPYENAGEFSATNNPMAYEENALRYIYGEDDDNSTAGRTLYMQRAKK